MRIVIALGGKALVPRGAVVEPLERSELIETAAQLIARLGREHEIVVTHGYGQRIGLVAMLAETEHAEQRFPLDMIGAEDEAVIGHRLAVALRNAAPDKPLATLLTQIEVGADDPAFQHYNKPIGPPFSAADGHALAVARERGWHLRVEDGSARRVVPAPMPLRVLELEVIRGLIDDGVIVTCAGSGGVPLVRDDDGRLRGVEAVVEKELAAAVLAAALEAHLLLMLTDVPCVERDWGSPNARPIGTLVAAEADPSEFIEGTMRPKVAAACHFVRATGNRAAIGAPADAAALVAGECGTQIVPARTATDTAHAPAEARAEAPAEAPPEAAD